MGHLRVVFHCSHSLGLSSLFPGEAPCTRVTKTATQDSPDDEFSFETVGGRGRGARLPFTGSISNNPDGLALGAEKLEAGADTRTEWGGGLSGHVCPPFALKGAGSQFCLLH